MPTTDGCLGIEVTGSLRRPPQYAIMMPQIAASGSGIDLIPRALEVGTEVVRDTLHLNVTAKRPSGHVDGRRRHPRQSGQRLVPKYQQIAAEVDGQRNPGEGFDRLAQKVKVGRGVVVRAYDFASRDEVAAAARQGRKTTRPPYKLRDASRAARRKSGKSCPKRGDELRAGGPAAQQHGRGQHACPTTTFIGYSLPSLPSLSRWTS